MGLYYSTFISKLRERYAHFDGNCEEFFNEEMEKICSEYSVHIGGSHWAMNIEEFARITGADLGKYKKQVSNIMEEEFCNSDENAEALVEALKNR
jgi:D-tyrosyl-tRNA(Tyr) deacylase